MKDNNQKKRVVWPPKIVHQTPMGAMRDIVPDWCPRDIGRSSKLSDGTVLFQFGDTFFHNAEGGFIGLSDNTCSLGTDSSNPNLSFYKPGHLQDGQIVEPFIRKVDSEQNQDLKVWSFGGVVEEDFNYRSKLIEGWTFFEVCKPVPGTLDFDFKYTGVARVLFDPIHKKVWTVRRETSSEGHQLFKHNEIKFGDFCAVRAGEMIYVFGHKTKNKDVCVARVPKAHAANRKWYQYWNGKYWTDDISSCTTVIPDMQHGQIFSTCMFGVESPYRWAFVGCTARGDNKVIMGRAMLPQGPWDIHKTEASLYWLVQPHQGEFCYCVYPHPWADATENTGDLTISWSEGGMTGGVLMSKIRLAMEDVAQDNK